MASAASVSSSTTLFHRPLGSASPQCVRFPSLPPQKHNRCRCLVSLFPQQKVATNIAAAAMASDDLPVLIVEEVEVNVVEVDSPLPPPSEITATQSSSDPDILKAIEDVWENLEDRYIVLALVVAVLVAIWASSGMISAIDRLPLVPGVLEFVGIAYTGWFAYQNLIFQANREALFRKINGLYCEITGSS